MRQLTESQSQLVPPTQTSAFDNLAILQTGPVGVELKYKFEVYVLSIFGSGGRAGRNHKVAGSIPWPPLSC